MIVDDDPMARAAVEHLLRSAGYDAATADSGEAALAWLQSETADLVLLDVVMPGMSGLEVCRRMREHARTDSIPIVFLTAKNRVTDMSEAQRAGSDLYLTKPLLPGRLLKMVEIFLADLHLARKQTATSSAASFAEGTRAIEFTPAPRAGRVRDGGVAKSPGRPHSALLGKRLATVCMCNACLHALFPEP